MKTNAYIAIGSNQDAPQHQVATAATALAQLPQSTLLACSPWYITTPIGPGDQPNYINGVVLLNTALDAESLLRELQAIETRQGRQRTVHWGPRTLDLDLLLYGNSQIDSPNLTVPHPRMRERNFVICPLFDIAPDLILPDGVALSNLRSRCSREGILAIDHGTGVIV